MDFKRHFLGFIVLLVLVFSQPNTIIAQDTNPPTAQDMEAALNEWRLEEGLAPMKINPTLQALAQLQLDYILQLPNIPPNIHDGILHEGPRERALWEPYEWNFYGIRSRVSLEEITVAQKTVELGISWWKNSPVHNAAATNPNYREMGVATAPYPNGFVFVAVLAGQPDVFPAMIHPDRETLYLTRETYSGTLEQHMDNINEIRLLDTNQNALTDWQPWEKTLSLDEIDDPIFYVEYSNGERTVLTEVDREHDVFSLPGYETLEIVNTSDIEDLPTPENITVEITAVTDEMFALKVLNPVPLYLTDFEFYALQLESGSPSTSFAEQVGTTFAGEGACFIFIVEGAPFTTSEGCPGQTMVTHVTPGERFWYDSAREVLADLFILSNKGKLLADCREAVVGCKFEVAALELESSALLELAGTRRIRLDYTPNTFAITNIGGQTLNISSLRLSDGEKTFSAMAWNDDNGYLWQFPTGDCFQIAVSGTQNPIKPASCELRHGWVSVKTSQKFWTSDTFEVYLNNNIVGECDTDASACVIDLP